MRLETVKTEAMRLETTKLKAVSPCRWIVVARLQWSPPLWWQTVRRALVSIDRRPYWTHGEIHFWTRWIKPNFDFNYTFPIDFALIGIGVPINTLIIPGLVDVLRRTHFIRCKMKCWLKSTSCCGCLFNPADLPPNVILLCAKSIGKVILQSKFGLIQ